MKERPIIFNADMVRALLDGRKTQTRRIVKPQPVLNLDSEDIFRIGKKETLTLGYYSGSTPYRWNRKVWAPDRTPCPYGIPGDRLWVRETWRLVDFETRDGQCSAAIEFEDGRHGARKFGGMEMINERCGWRPSIHMPRWVSRITLEITDVRVQRVQEITEEDAYAEGCPALHRRIPGYGILASPDTSARDHFRSVWNSIHGPGAWERNEWVWAITFKRLEQR